MSARNVARAAVKGTTGGTPAFWRDRPTLVTGATGLVGGWLVRRLLDLGADVVCLVRDWVPQSDVLQGELMSRVRIVRGDIRSQPLIERVLGEFEIDVVFHLAAQTVVGVANRNPVSTLDSNIRGQQHTKLDGSVVRPSLVILDDPQTRQSAASPAQTN